MEKYTFKRTLLFSFYERLFTPSFLFFDFSRLWTPHSYIHICNRSSNLLLGIRIKPVYRLALSVEIKPTRISWRKVSNLCVKKIPCLWGKESIFEERVTKRNSLLGTPFLFLEKKGALSTSKMSQEYHEHQWWRNYTSESQGTPWERRTLVYYPNISP